MGKKELLEMIKTEEKSEKIFEMLKSATQAELRDIAFECLCCIKLGLVEDNEELKAGMLEDITRNLEEKMWR